MKDIEAGDLVVLLTVQHGDSARNPVFGLTQGKIKGVVISIGDGLGNPFAGGLPVRVRWDSGYTNRYRYKDLLAPERCFWDSRRMLFKTVDGGECVMSLTPDGKPCGIIAKLASSGQSPRKIPMDKNYSCPLPLP